MRTAQHKGLLAIGGLLTICLFSICFSTSLQGREKRYEIRPEITVPQSQTDISHVIDAYDRLMNNYMRLTEDNLMDLRTNISNVTTKLDSIDRKISALSAQLKTIQNKLGIEPPPKPSCKPLDSKSSLQTEKQNLEAPR